jgi:hypothetical protein
MTADEPDVELAAAVRARELRFECKPEVEVRAHADSQASAASESVRDNLPDELEERVVYRDLAVRWRLWARLADPDRLPEG